MICPEGGRGEPVALSGQGLAAGPKDGSAPRIDGTVCDARGVLCKACETGNAVMSVERSRDETSQPRSTDSAISALPARFDNHDRLVGTVRLRRPVIFRSPLRPLAICGPMLGLHAASACPRGHTD